MDVVGKVIAPLAVLCLLLGMSFTTFHIFKTFAGHHTIPISKIKGPVPRPIEKILNIVEKLKCERISQVNRTLGKKVLQKLIICNGKDTLLKDHYLTLFTYMYYAPSKMFIFNNTLHVWAKLKPFVNPVLFMTPNDMILASELVATACSLGWKVYSAPLCNEHGYPALKAMFEVASKESKSFWYGFAKANILFSSNLVDALEFIRQLPLNPLIYFLAGKSLYLELPHGSNTSIDSPVIVKETVLEAKQNPSVEHGYFFTNKESMVRGLFAHENDYTILFALHSPGIMDIDVTSAIDAIYLGTKSPKTFNSLNSRKTNYKYEAEIPSQPYLPMLYINYKETSACMHYSLTSHDQSSNVPLYYLQRKKMWTNRMKIMCMLARRTF